MLYALCIHLVELTERGVSGLPVFWDLVKPSEIAPVGYSKELDRAVFMDMLFFIQTSWLLWKFENFLEIFLLVGGDPVVLALGLSGE